MTIKPGAMVRISHDGPVWVVVRIASTNKAELFRRKVTHEAEHLCLYGTIRQVWPVSMLQLVAAA